MFYNLRGAWWLTLYAILWSKINYHSDYWIVNCCAYMSEWRPMMSLWHQYWLLVAMVTYPWHRWYGSMANSGCHAQPIFQWHYELKFLQQKNQIFLKYIIILQSFNYERHTLKRTRKMWKFKCNQDFSYINLSISHRLHLFLLLFIYSNISSWSLSAIWCKVGETGAGCKGAGCNKGNISYIFCIIMWKRLL